MAEIRKRFGREAGVGDGGGTRTGDVAVGESAGPSQPDPLTQQVERDRATTATRSGAPDATTPRPPAPAPSGTPAPTVGEARARQRDQFGGFNWGSAFFGWLVSIGLLALVTAVLAAAGTALGLTDVSTRDAQTNAETIGIGGGILLLVASMIAYYSGGYVAGRMSRFDGARQGFGVWVFGLIVTVAIAAAGWLFGDKYNVLDQLNLPRIPVDAGDLTTGGVIALAAVVLGTLIAAMAGGKVGQRYHLKVDRAAER